ncbi:MAG TPA: sigma-70 family RNA polymerase sigma factor [Opitutales bacterium]|nr:sigma-70 family RNA polymerase sigma factor [Opitutales bacterium]
MSTLADTPPRPAAPRARFATTRWTMVLAAGRKSSPDAARALEELCRAYWYPLYAYVRRRGHSTADAEDLTQAFFTRLLENDFLRGAARDKGRFRTFLLVAFQRFCANEWDRSRAQKRGGGQHVFSLNLDTAERRYHAEPADELSADRIFERRWALTLIEQTIARLRAEYATAGKTRDFDALKVFLTGDAGEVPYVELAAQLGQGEGALRVAVHRLRKRFRELFRQEIAQTVSSPSEIDAELRHLISVLS